MGNPFVHLDLSADNVAAAKKFYGKVFDWKFKDFPQMGWTGIHVGEGVGGGIGSKNMPGQPTAWTAYVGVTDVKKTLDKAKKAGAQILVPYMQVGDMGSLGVFKDPQGAAIGVWQPTNKASAPAKSTAKKSAKKPAAKKATAKSAAPAKTPAKAKPAAKTSAKSKRR